MRTKLIVNPAAGRKIGVPTNLYGVADVTAALAAHQIAADVVETCGPGHGRQLATEAVGERYQLVLVAGGDGTIHEVAQALAGTPVVLGILPLGSVMNLARMLNIPRDLEGAVHVLLAGEVAVIDLGRVGDEYFLEAAGVGMEAQIFQLTGEIDRGRWQRLLDLLRAIRGRRRYRLDLTVDGQPLVVRAISLTATNGPLYAAAQSIAPNARLDDGVLDVAIFESMGRLDLIRQWFGGGSFGRPGIAFRHLQARRLVVHAGRRLPVHADAFPAGFTPATIEVVPAALRVIVGPSTAGERPAASRLLRPARPE
ncbi:MAG: diacylglycerol kinase family lipid kinase [Chloroflexi bacterium]|nr:diacylglycerol kinase family lipid kinase [Chloroflexota bacterium]